MYTQHPETLDQLVADHHEHLKASMRAAESDRAVWLKYRSTLGSLLISFGQRVRGNGMPDLVPTSPAPKAMTTSVQTTP